MAMSPSAPSGASSSPPRRSDSADTLREGLDREAGRRPTQTDPPRKLDDSPGSSDASKEEMDVEKSAADLEDSQDAVAVADADPANTFPEGGLRAYMTVVGGSLALFTTFGLSNCFGAFQAEFQNNQLSTYTPSTISWIGSVNLAVMFCGGLPSGRLFDAGYFRYELAAGTLLYLAGIYSLSFATEFYSIFLSYSVCLAIGSGLIFTPVVAVVGSYFFRKRSLMIGACTACAALGAVIFPIMLNRLFASIGFGPTVRVVAYLQTGLFALVNLLMRPRDLPRKVQPPIIPLMLSFARQPTTWLVSIGCSLVIMGFWIPLFYIQTFLEQNGTNPILATYSLTIVNAAATIARMGSGALADRWGILNTAIPVSALTGILTFAMVGANNDAGAVVWMLLFGFANGGFVTILTPSLMSLARNVSEIGVRVGFGFIWIAIATLIGTPIAGALLSASGTYAAPCCFGGGLIICGTGLLLVARFRLVKSRGKWKV